MDGVRIAGTDVYEWFPGGAFLVHHVDVQMGDERVRALEMIGDPDPADGGRLRMRAFDNERGYAEMRAGVDDAGVWTFAADTMRTTLTIDPDNKSMAAKWERSSVGTTWADWMDVEFAREAWARRARTGPLVGQSSNSNPVVSATLIEERFTRTMISGARSRVPASRWKAWTVRRNAVRGIEGVCSLERLCGFCPSSRDATQGYASPATASR